MKNKHIVRFLSTVTKIYNTYLSFTFFYKEKKCIKDKIKANTDLKDSHKGESCFILATGPSLKKVDFSKLSDKFVFTVNLLYKNPNFDQLKSDIHVFADSIFFGQEVEKDLNNDINEKILNKGIELFLPNYTRDFIFKYNLIDKVRVYAPIKHFRTGYSDKIDISRPMTDFNTVVFQCIQIAIYMGFKTIYLLGCDCTGVQRVLSDSQDTYCYKVDKTASKAYSNSDAISDVQAIFQTWANIFEQYKVIEKYTQKIGVKIYNLSNPTILDSIERKDINEVLK